MSTVLLAAPPRVASTESTASVLRSPERRFLLNILWIGLAIRLAVVFLSYRGLIDPSDGFGEFGAEMGWTARSIFLGKGFSSPFLPFTGPTALVPPVFPYLLAGIFRLFGLYTPAAAIAVLSLSSAFSALTALPIYLGTRRSFGIRTARLAAWAWIFYPFAVYYSSAVIWDYALTGLLFAISFWFVSALDARTSALRWFGCGLVCGIAILSNPSILLVLLLLLALAAWKLYRGGTQWIRRPALAVLGIALVISPWMVRNACVMHAASPIRDGFWLEFWAGNAGDTSTSNPAWAHPATNPVEMEKWVTLGENHYLATKHALSLASVHDHPRAFAVTSLRRALRFWTGYWSVSREYLSKQPLDLPNVPFCTAVTLAMLVGLARVWKTDRMAAMPYLITAIFFPLPYYFSHSSMDYRQPIESIVIVLVSRGLIGCRQPGTSEHLAFAAESD